MPTPPQMSSSSTTPTQANQQTAQEIHAFYQEKISLAEAHFRNSASKQAQEITRLKSQLAERQDTIERMEAMHQKKIQEASSLLNNLKNSSIKDLNEFRSLIVEKGICQEDKVKKEGFKALKGFLEQKPNGEDIEAAKESEIKLANLQRKINDLESKNQNLTMLVQWAKDRNAAVNPEYKKCTDRIIELEERLGRINEEEYNSLKDECIILKAENAAFRQENAALLEKTKDAEVRQKTTSNVPSHPLFLQNFLANLESLLSEGAHEKKNTLEAKYIQTADKTTKPIFQRIIDLKASSRPVAASSNSIPTSASAAPKIASQPITEVPLTSSQNPLERDPIVADQKRKLRRSHANYTYEHEAEDMETLEYIVFEQEDYIRKLEKSLDMLLLQREPQRV